MLGLTGIALVGLLKVNVAGPGITECVRQLWRQKDAPAAAK